MVAGRTPSGDPSPPRRPGLAPGRRRRGVALLAALSAVVVGLSAAAPAASADNGGQQVQATVVGSSGGTSGATVSELQSDCAAGLYTGPDYDPNQVFPTTETWSVGPLLRCLSPAIAFTPQTSVIVGTADLSYADLNTPSDFDVPAETPVIFSDGTNLLFERPSDTSPDSPTDAEVEPDPTPLALTVFTGPALTVSITPSATSVAPGGQVSLTTTVSGGSATNFQWTFGGAQGDASSPDPTVSFPAGTSGGTDTLTVQASDPSTGAAGVASTQVTVTGAPASATSTTTAAGTPPAPQPTTTTTTTTSAPTGGRGATGGHGSGGGGGGGGATTTTTHITSVPAPTTATTTSRRGTRTTPTRTSGTRTAAAPTTPATTPSPSPGPAPARARQRTRARPRHLTPSAGRHPRRAPARHPAAVGRRRAALVRGQLIGALELRPAATSPLAHPAAAAAPTGGASASVAHVGRLTWPGLVGAIVVLAGLLGLGAGRELRRGRGRMRTR